MESAGLLLLSCWPCLVSSISVRLRVASQFISSHASIYLELSAFAATKLAAPASCIGHKTSIFLVSVSLQHRVVVQLVLFLVHTPFVSA